MPLTPIWRVPAPILTAIPFLPKKGLCRQPLQICWSNSPEGTPRVVTRVLTQDRELLAYLGSISLRPQTQVTILERKPFNGPLRLLLNDSEDLISHEVACLIVVSEEDVA